MPARLSCSIIYFMRSFATVIFFSALFCSLLSCDGGKSGPFTFTNTTGKTVYVLIDQDGVLEKEFGEGEKYTGKDYFTPQITFVKGFSSAGEKSIIDNRFTATTSNCFDYSFKQVEGATLNIMVHLPAYFATQAPSLVAAYLVEVNGRLGEYSNTTLSLTSLSEQATTNQTESGTTAASLTSYQLYTNAPEFKIYRDKTVDGKQQPEDITNLFTIALGKTLIPPESNTGTATVQWNLEITYPKVEVVQE